MKVTIIQLDIEWGSPQKNIKKIELLMRQAPDSDLYVLPEMWSTGFATEPQDFAEDELTSISLRWMRDTARQKHCAISGSLAIRLSGTRQYVNRHYFVDGRSLTEKYYDKHHLFRYGGEDRYYQAGGKQVVVEYEGFRLMLLTCYDLRFPVDDEYSHYRGQSAIISPIGKTLVSCRANSEETASFLLNLETIVHQRSKFKVLDDRDVR